MWTYDEDGTLMANCTVKKCYKDGVLKHNRLIAYEGYVMHLVGDNGEIDEETGEYTPPSYVKQVILPTTIDINNYEAIKEDVEKFI